MRRPKNAIFISTANSIEHEIWKTKICYELKQQGKSFITECVRNTKDEKGKERRVDIVELDSGKEIEIELDPKRAKRFEGENNVIVIKVWEHERSKTEHTDQKNK
jgi:hypothetical protein